MKQAYINVSDRRGHIHNTQPPEHHRDKVDNKCISLSKDKMKTHNKRSLVERWKYRLATVRDKWKWEFKPG